MVDESLQLLPLRKWFICPQRSRDGNDGGVRMCVWKLGERGGGIKEKWVKDEGRGARIEGVRGGRGRGRASLLASYAFGWRKTEAVDCQEKCSWRIFNSSKKPRCFQRNVRNTHQTSFSTILILLSLYLAPVARLCLRFLHFLRGCVVVKATNFHQSSTYQTSAVTNVFVTAVVFKVGGREGGTERKRRGDSLRKKMK